MEVDFSEYALSMHQISKVFPGVQALDRVDLYVRPGEVHALVGENGAGKSTLMKILAGAQPKDSGEIRIRGRHVEIRSPHDARRLGISMIYQEFNLIPQMNAAQNIFLGREMGIGPGIIRRGAMRRAAQELIRQLGSEVNIDVPVRRLSLAQRQMVEIARALSVRADIIVMDEPTSSLTDKEIAELFNAIRRLTARGASIIYVSHRMEEIFEICNRVTALRDGKTVGTRDIKSGLRADDVIQMMVGRDLSDMYPKRDATRRGEVVRVEDISMGDALRHVSFHAHAGEIVGIAGLVGAGRTEMARVLFGADHPTGGQIFIEGRPIRLASPRAAISLGIGLLTADRKEQGLVLKLPVAVNTSLARLDKVSVAGVINRGAQARAARKYVTELKIRPGDIRRRVKYLSGGNQQKVVLAKWLLSASRLLIFDEPTRGIDVGAKVEIYQLMNRLVADGACIIMISSELPEIIGMSDRILVMREGRLVKEFTRGEGWPDGIKRDILRYAISDLADVDMHDEGRA